ncbi:YceI family protein [Flavobacteriales bacterium]|nr:YceI family protein [Flavobacteriales bacterium]
MKKFIIPALLFAAVMTTSCGSNAVEASDAKEVKEVAITGTYNVLADHNHVDWKAWHLGKTGERYGKVTLESAEASVNEGSLVGGKFVLDLTALTVENFGDDTAQNDKLRGHLTSGDFFLTDSFPTATFEITGVDTTSGDFNSVVTGNLTIKGVSKSISFKSNVEIAEDAISISSETFEVNREDWGLSYHNEGTVGVPADYLIANEIAFTIHSNLTK